MSAKLKERSPTDPAAYQRCPKCAMYLELGRKGMRCPICGELADMILEPGPQKGAFPIVEKAIGKPALPADLQFALQQNEALHEQLADKIADRLTDPTRGPQSGPAILGPAQTVLPAAIGTK